MKLVLLLAILLAVVTAQTSLFDDFVDFSSIDANSNEPLATAVVNGANIIGTRRNLTLTVGDDSNPALEGSCTIVAGFFALSTDVSVTGACEADYSGPDGNGFTTPVNYNALGCDCWNMRILESDNNVGFAITANSQTFGPQTSEFMLAVDIPSALDLCIPFFGDREAYNDIVGVNFRVEALVANVDVNLQSVCCQPSVTCVHTITALNGADVDNLVVGDDIKLSIMCRNYESQPADLQELTVSFPFDSAFGTLDAGSIMCDGDVAPTAPGASVVNNALEFQASLIDGESINCMVDVALIAGGSVDNIAANIFTSQGDPRFPFQSHTDIDRQGSLEFCELPVPASLVIVDPPTTLPPTTEPPTTEPPTTEPPTTEPPTTEPPTTEPPTTEPPTTAPPTTEPPTTEPPTTEPPTTEPPTTEPPTTEPPTTEPPTTEPPTTEPPTTEPPTTEPPTTEPPTTEPPTTEPPTTEPPTTEPPTTEPPTTEPPTTEPPTTEPPTTEPPTTEPPTTEPPTTQPPTTLPPITTPPTTEPPTTEPPTTEPPTTEPPTTEPPTTEPPTTEPPTTEPPTTEPPTTEPPTTEPPTTEPPTTEPPTTEPPTTEPPTTEPPTTEPPTTEPPTTEPPTTEPPTTEPPTTEPPTTEPPTTEPPTTEPPTTQPPTTLPPTTQPPTTLPPTTVPPTPVRFVCVSPRIINGECDCQTFPCFEADDGSNSFRCETDEWYCWFVARIPASGRFQVGYRGQMCYCEI